MTELRWSKQADADLESIHEYIAQDSVAYAESVIRDIVEAAQQLRDFPRSGRIVPEENDPTTREVVVGNYRVIYELIGNKVIILTILHGARLYHGRE